MASSLDNGCQMFSELLSVREKGILFILLGPQCEVVASAVAQVFLTTETESGDLSWSYWGCGVACLIKDHSKNSYFLRLYCVKRAKLLWEQKLYTQFKYSVSRPFFHTFPSDDCQAGLNFADETEAEGFHAAVERCIQSTQEKISGWTMMTHTVGQDGSTGNDCSRLDPSRFEMSDSAESGPEPQEVLNPKKCSSMPTSSTTSDEPDPAIMRLMRQAGLIEVDMKDRHTSEVVHRIINNLGGLEDVQREIKNRGPASQTLPRTAGASISLALRKGPLPAVPSASQHVSKGLNLRPLPPWIPPPPSTPAPSAPGGIKKSISFKPVGSPSAAESDFILTALRDAFRKDRNLQCHTEQDTVDGVQL